MGCTTTTRPHQFNVNKIFVVLPLLLLLTACDLRIETPTIERIRERGALVVLTRNAPTTYYMGRDQEPEGFEHDLALEYGHYLGVQVQFKLYNNRNEILDALLHNEGDLAAAGLAQTAELAKKFIFGPVYQEVDRQVVCRRGGRRPTNFLQLARVGLTIQEGSGVEERLQELTGLVPNLTWKVDREQSAEQILEQVWRKEVECTIADSNIVAINRRYLPELVVKFPIGATQSLAWVIPKQARLLEQELTAWFAMMRTSGRLEELFERYYGFIESDHMHYDYVDNRLFFHRINSRLGQYKALFQLASKQYGDPWKLLAAQAYQESHWNPQATSFTGVKGLMMLTHTTANAMGIKDREDPKESIMGGAWYLADLRRRLPKSITEPDRTWIALAAYNVGMGHILDARALARQLGKKPDLWKDLQLVLPLLSWEKYYKNLKNGYARGAEPVRYVQQIRHYYDILQRME